jgi:hexokinase
MLHFVQHDNLQISWDRAVGDKPVEEARNRVKTFLADQGMYHEDISIQDICALFLEEMDKGLAGRGSSLAMLPTYIETERELPRNKPVIVMDAGGTNFRVATVTFKEQGEPEISDFQVFAMPGIERELGKEEFFGTMAGYIKDVVGKSDSVGFCFSYPIEMSPNKDGKVLYFSKEIKADAAVGHMIGKSLNEAIRSQGLGQAKNMVLLNDTVATLLAGRGRASGRIFDSYMGFILGTGTNTAYVERNSNITKASDLDSAKSQIINVESGGFGKAPRGTIDEKFDAASISPGINVFEKMISGAYLGPLCGATIRTAVEAGLFSPTAAKKLTALKETTTKDLSEFMAAPEDGNNLLSAALEGADEKDVVALYYLTDALIERSAKLTAINLSSVAIKCGKGRSPHRPVCIVAEGTTFYHLKSLRQKVEYYLKQYLVDARKVYYEIVSVENATLLGAATAGLTN